ncbi:MAG: methionyl-tRNA formyltransferase [Clostridia bacterium]|nr:methionyl-tRNA formyltransferase [Clostridia bacterium]
MNNPKSNLTSYNIVFFGSALFAERSFAALLGSRHNVLAVVTQPDRAKGRGKKVEFSNLKQMALDEGLMVMQPATAKDEDFLNQLESLGADLFVTASYGNFLPQRLLDMPPMGTVNVHGSLLPDLRGAAPIQWSIIRGYKETGVSTMLTDIGMDSGDVLLSCTREIDDAVTYGQLYELLADDGAELLLKTLDAMAEGTLTPIKQDPALVTYAPMILKQDAGLDFTMSAQDIVNKVRGMNPSPVTYAYYGNERLKVWEAKVYLGDVPSMASGSVFAADGKGLYVVCGQGAVELTVIQGDGGKAMKAQDYLRGHAIAEGTLLKPNMEN